MPLLAENIELGAEGLAMERLLLRGNRKTPNAINVAIIVETVRLMNYVMVGSEGGFLQESLILYIKE